MNDAFGVSRVQCIGDLDAQINQTVSFERASQNRFPQSLAFEILHHNEAQAAMFANFVDGADVGVVQSGSGAGFTTKTLERLGIVRDVVGQKLQSDQATQGGILGAIHHTHPAAAQLVENSVVGNRLPKNRLCIGHESNMLAEQ